MLVCMRFLWYQGTPQSTNTSIFLFKQHIFISLSMDLIWNLCTSSNKITIFNCTIYKITGNKVKEFQHKVPTYYFDYLGYYLTSKTISISSVYPINTHNNTWIIERNTNNSRHQLHFSLCIFLDYKNWQQGRLQIYKQHLLPCIICLIHKLLNGLILVRFITYMFIQNNLTWSTILNFKWTHIICI